MRYIDNTSGISYTRTFNPLRVKGFDPIDDLSDYPNVVHEIVDGSLIHQTVGIRRNFTIELGVLVDPIDRTFAGNFWRSTTKFLTYTHDGILETIQVIRNQGIIQTEWKDDYVNARYVVLYLQDKFILSEFPDTRNHPIVETNMYIKKRVLIVGDQGTPESFSTNSGKLATCDAPNTIYPYFDDTIEKYSIDVSRVYQDCFFSVPSIEATSGGVLTFTVARSDSGNPQSGVSYFCDIIISVVNI